MTCEYDNEREDIMNALAQCNERLTALEAKVRDHQLTIGTMATALANLGVEDFKYFHEREVL